MEVLATELRQGRLQQTLFDIANHVGRHLECSRVAIGLVQEDVVRLAAMSNAAWFEKYASVSKLYIAAMEEVCDRLAPVAYTRPSSDGSPFNAELSSAHSRLAAEHCWRSHPAQCC